MISLQSPDQAVPEDQMFSMTDTAPVLPYGQEYATAKAEKMSLALGDATPGPDALLNDINLGNEQNWSLVLAQREAIRNQEARLGLLRDVAANRDPSALPSREEMDLVSSLTNEELYSPDISTILAKRYSEMYTNLVGSVDENRVSQDETPESLDALDRSQYVSERLMLAQESLEKVKASRETESVGTTVLSWAKTFVPGYTFFMNRNRIEEAPTAALLEGSNMQEQLSYLYSLSPAQFKEVNDRVVDELMQSNPLMAEQWAQAVISFGSTDEGLANLFTVLDAASVVPVGALTRAGAKAARGVLNGPRAIAKTAGEIGLHGTAAKTDFAEAMSRGDISGVARIDQSNIAQVEQRLPTFMSPGKAWGGVEDLSSAARNRIYAAAQRGNRAGEAALKILETNQLVDRLEPHQIMAGADEAFERIKDYFPGASHHIIDAAPRLIRAEEDALLNTNQIAVRFGKRDGTLFATEKAARNFVQRTIGKKTNDYEVRQDGVGGWFVELTRPITETGNIRDLEIPTEYQTPKSLVDIATRGLARGADYQLPQHHVEARGRVVHGQEYMEKALNDAFSVFSTLSKGQRQGLTRVLRSSQRDETWLRTEGDFNAKYTQLTGSVPTKAQYEAYETVATLSDLDYILRDADIVKQKTRLGAERITFQMDRVETPGQPPVKDQKVFDGIVMDSIPWNKKDGFFIQPVMDGVADQARYSRYVSASDRQAIDNAVAAGFKIVLDPETATYYVVNDFKRDRIPLGSLGYKEGGHWEYQFSHYIKQGNVQKGRDTVNRYTGDITLASVPSAEQGKQVAALLERGRQLVKAKDTSARRFFDENLDDFISYADFIKAVKAKKINLDTPIVTVAAGQRTVSTGDWTKGFDNFVDVTNNENNVFSAVTGRYIDQRSEKVFDVLASENNRVVKTNHEALLDPLDAFVGTMGNLIDLRLVNDYKYKAVSDWAQEFGHLFRDSREKVLTNPEYYLQNGANMYAPGVDPSQLIRAENVRKRTLELNNYKSAGEALVESLKMRIIDNVYDRWGIGARNLMNDKVLPTISNLDTYLRASAFHTKLGLFNPKQLFLQASEVARIAMVAPVRSLDASRALPLNRIAAGTENEQVLRGLANKFAKQSWGDKNDWLEMIRVYKDSGFSIVGADTAYLDNARPSLLKGQAGAATSKVLQAGTSFFREGEGIARNLAFSVAWKEYRLANAGKKFTRADHTKILQRAKDLTLNMTRDTNAVWQRGYGSVITQFFGYHARFMEQIWDGGIGAGRKLSAPEKARVIAGMSVLYGVPATVGGVTGYVPVRDLLKGWLAEEGVTTDQNPALDIFMDGALPDLFSAMTGADMDFANSYGPTGNPVFFDIVNGDKDWVEILGGASGGILADTLKSLGPTAQWLMDTGSLQGDNVTTPPAEVLLQPFRNVSSVQNSLRAWEAINTGRWLSRSGTLLANDVTFTEAISSFLLGVTPERISDSYRQLDAKYNNDKHRRSYQREIENLTRKEMDAANRGDEESMEYYAQQAKAAAIRGGLTPTEFQRSRRNGLSDKSFTQKANETYEKYLRRRRQINELNKED